MFFLDRFQGVDTAGKNGQTFESTRTYFFEKTCGKRERPESGRKCRNSKEQAEIGHVCLSLPDLR